MKPADVLRRAGLPADLLTRPQAGLGTAEYFSFWRSLEAAVGDPLFPLRLVEAFTPEVFSPPIFAAMCRPNLRLAALRLSHFKRLVAPIGAAGVGRQAGCTGIEPALAGCAGHAATVFGGERVGVLRAPGPARHARARKGKTPSVTFSAADAELPFLTANEAMWQVFAPDLRRRLTELDASAAISERVRALLLESLPSGQASMEAAAARLAMSKRTLHRRLGEEGVTFQFIVKATREQLARHYLTQTTLSNGEIAFLLGFDDPNSFFRAFHALSGVTPAGLRRGAAR